MPPSTSIGSSSPIRARSVPQAIDRLLDERLAAPPRVDRHAQREVGRHRERLERCAGVQGHAGTRARLADQVQREVDVRRGLDVEGDVVGARP
jgi:hypothetical protein